MADLKTKSELLNRATETRTRHQKGPFRVTHYTCQARSETGHEGKTASSHLRTTEYEDAKDGLHSVMD